jgi:isoquinoline 1-oxidoreductase beta subunit
MPEQLIDHPAPESPSRRDMLKVGLGTGGALFVVFGIPSIAKHFQQDTNTASMVTEAKVETAPFAPSAFIRIERSGDITLTMPMVEMGQGIYTSLAMLLAEELEVGLDQVKLEHAPPNDALYANAILHRQLTGMSSSIRAFWTPLRQAGALARTLLIAAAAKQWGVDPAVCWAKHGVVSAGSRQLSYGQLVDAAAALPVPTPDSLALKDPKDFTLIGTPAKRRDTPDKVNGHAEFGIDTKQPGMKVAAIAISPVFGGKPKSLDEAAARAVKGVRQVVRVDEAVAVVADHMGAAKKGLAAAAIQWDDGPNAKVSSADIVRQLEEASKQPGVVARNEGDTEKALASAVQRLDAVYQLPFLAHAAMEPMNCTVHLRKDGCDIWVGTQAPTLTPRPWLLSSPACRRTRSRSTIICSAAASADGWMSTAASSPSRLRSTWMDR